MDPPLTIQCDNTNTIALVTKEIATFQTKLRHVDIHNHWLRQEHKAGRIRLQYTPTNAMIADGLTKALTHDNHQQFVTMLNLVPLQSLIEARAHAANAPSPPSGQVRTTTPGSTPSPPSLP
jgi:hypothetical protein